MLATVYEAGPTLNHHWVNAPFLSLTEATQRAIQHVDLMLIRQWTNVEDGGKTCN